MKKILTITASLLILAGSLVSCEEKENDIDMSKIDFSNIENLHAQPLPVIQKCVQGKWKWYVSYGGLTGVNYPDNTFVTINDEYYIVEYYDGTQLQWHFTWKKYPVDAGYKTYVMWNKEQNKAGWYFHSIKNDTLTVLANTPPGSADIPNHFGFVRSVSTGKYH